MDSAPDRGHSRRNTHDRHRRLQSRRQARSARQRTRGEPDRLVRQSRQAGDRTVEETRDRRRDVAPAHGHPVDIDGDGDLDVVMAFGIAAGAAIRPIRIRSPGTRTSASRGWEPSGRSTRSPPIFRKALKRSRAIWTATATRTSSPQVGARRADSPGSRTRATQGRLENAPAQAELAERGDGDRRGSGQGRTAGHRRLRRARRERASLVAERGALGERRMRCP